MGNSHMSSSCGQYYYTRVGITAPRQISHFVSDAVPNNDAGEKKKFLFELGFLKFLDYQMFSVNKNNLNHVSYLFLKVES